MLGDYEKDLEIEIKIEKNRAETAKKLKRLFALYQERENWIKEEQKYITIFITLITKKEIIFKTFKDRNSAMRYVYEHNPLAYQIIVGNEFMSKDAINQQYVR